MYKYVCVRARVCPLFMSIASTCPYASDCLTEFVPSHRARQPMDQRSAPQLSSRGIISSRYQQAEAGKLCRTTQAWWAARPRLSESGAGRLQETASREGAIRIAPCWIGPLDEKVPGSLARLIHKNGDDLKPFSNRGHDCCYARCFRGREITVRSRHEVLPIDAIVDHSPGCRATKRPGSKPSLIGSRSVSRRGG